VGSETKGEPCGKLKQQKKGGPRLILPRPLQKRMALYYLKTKKKKKGFRIRPGKRRGGKGRGAGLSHAPPVKRRTPSIAPGGHRKEEERRKKKEGPKMRLEVCGAVRKEEKGKKKKRGSFCSRFSRCRKRRGEKSQETVASKEKGGSSLPTARRKDDLVD